MSYQDRVREVEREGEREVRIKWKPIYKMRGDARQLIKMFDFCPKENDGDGIDTFQNKDYKHSIAFGN